jgi:hypothetical protein
LDRQEAAKPQPSRCKVAKYFDKEMNSVIVKNVKNLQKYFSNENQKSIKAQAQGLARKCLMKELGKGAYDIKDIELQNYIMRSSQGLSNIAERRVSVSKNLLGKQIMLPKRQKKFWVMDDGKTEILTNEHLCDIKKLNLKLNADLEIEKARWQFLEDNVGIRGPLKLTKHNEVRLEFFLWGLGRRFYIAGEF